MNNENTKISIFGEAIKNDEGQTSMRRIVTFTTMLVMYGVVVVDMFTDYRVSEHIFDGLLFVVLGGLGSIASEKFLNRKNK